MVRARASRSISLCVALTRPFENVRNGRLVNAGLLGEFDQRQPVGDGRSFGEGESSGRHRSQPPGACDRTKERPLSSQRELSGHSQLIVRDDYTARTRTPLKVGGTIRAGLLDFARMMPEGGHRVKSARIPVGENSRVGLAPAVAPLSLSGTKNFRPRVIGGIFGGAEIQVEAALPGPAFDPLGGDSGARRVIGSYGSTLIIFLEGDVVVGHWCEWILIVTR